MKNAGLMMFLVICFCLTVIAQDTVSWKTLSPSWDEFTVELPDNSYVESINKEGTGSYTAFANKTYYFIFTGKPTDYPAFGTIINYAGDNKSVIKKIVIGGIKGDRYSFGDAEGFYHDFIVLRTSKRNYMFQTISELNRNPDTKKFLSSIKFDQPRTEKEEITNPVAKTDP